MHHPRIAALCSLALLALAPACEDESSGATRCDPAAADPCGTGRTCVAVRGDLAECRPTCDPDATPTTCSEGSACVPVGPVQAACVPTCDPAASDSCGADWLCVPAGDRGNICRPECDPAAPTCATGEVCQPLAAGGGVCTVQCSRDDPLACPGEQSCERRTDGLYACYDPVHLLGRVFDLATDLGIPAARVFAADETGGAASDGATTAPDGSYQLTVPVERELDGTPTPGGGTFTLRAGAQDYAPFPHGVRVALPIDAAALAVEADGAWTVQNPATDVGLIPLPAPTRPRGSISGNVVADDPGPGGTLIVANAGAPDPPIGWADRSGAYVVFNTDVGTYLVKGYKAFLQLETRSVMVDAGEHLVGIDLHELPDVPPATVSGSIQLVNPGACDGTSVVLVPEETFDPDLARGEVATGLRAPPPPAEPTVSGTWTIEGVPDGNYAVLAAFENDECVRDPDPGIAGTQIVHLAVPDTTGSRTIAIGESFKVTGALAIVFPGAAEPEAVSTPLTFRWEDDSSEDAYHIVVYDAFGEELWRRDDLPGESGGEPSVDYAGPALQPGMFYQFRVTSLRRTGTQPISMTEDLLGVFFLE
ncbi:MAG: hypothetical protein HY907_08285 [Deltaproteobacteria bacterium]|nr:hypothetical protein [Deltaproteobacteria bacterium]